MSSKDQSSRAKATQVEKPNQSSRAKEAQVEEVEEVDADVNELIERTWHYDCVVSPIHSSTPASQLRKPSISRQSSKTPTTIGNSLRGGSSAMDRQATIKALKGNKVSGQESGMVNGSDAIWQENKMPRGNPETISEECEVKDQIMPLRQVMVMMPKNWSELRGYVSLSSLIPDDDQSSNHGGEPIKTEPATQVSSSSQGAMGAFSGLFRIPLISSSNKGRRHSSNNKSGNDDDANTNACRSDQERRSSDQSFFLPSQIRRQLAIHN